MVFTGTYEQKLDAKNRLSVPSRFRAAFASGLTLVKSPDRCLAAWPTELYSQRTAEALSTVAPMSKEEREVKREFFANAFPMDLDSAGRITLPPLLMKRAGIEREVAIVGVGDSLELWDRAGWAAEDAEDDGDTD